MTMSTQTERCGQCTACRRVERAKCWALPNPPFTHASTETVRGWNQVLYDYPCKQWSLEGVAAYRRQILQTCSEAVQPRTLFSAVVRVTPTVPEHELHPQDADLGTQHTVEFSAPVTLIGDDGRLTELALDEFHATVPVKVLEDYEFSVHEIRPR